MSEPFDAVAVIRVIEAAETKLYALCQGRERFTMSVPVDLERDPDIVFQAAFTAGRATLTALTETRALLAQARAALVWQRQHCPVCHGQGCDGCERLSAALAATEEGGV